MSSTVIRRRRCYLVDTNVYAFGVWKTSPRSQDTHSEQAMYALFAFSDVILRLLKAVKPSPLIFIYDGPNSRAYRQDIYPLYKANRPPTGDALKKHLQTTQELLKILGLPILYSQGYEADDVIGSLSYKYREQGYSVTLVTADKDLMQLIQGAEDRWWDLSKSMMFDRRAIEKRFGIKPYRLAELLALTGDKSDNIPGVPGVSYSIGAKLLNYFNGLENLLLNIEKVKYLPIRSAETLAQSLDIRKSEIQTAYKLAKIVNDLPEEYLQVSRNKVDLLSLRELFPKTHASWQQIQRLEKALYEPYYSIE